MTFAEYFSLMPGAVIRRIHGRRTLRVVATFPRASNRGTILGMALVKVGQSWTGPSNPLAWYGAYVLQSEFEITGRTVRLPPNVRSYIRKRRRQGTWQE